MYKLLSILFLALFSVSCSSCAHLRPDGALIGEKRGSVGIIYSKTFLMISTKPGFTGTSTTPIVFSSAFGTSGTGTVVKHNDKTSFILTAAHVCTLAYENQVRSIFPFYDSSMYDKVFTKVNVFYDTKGKPHKAIPFAVNKSYDLCIMVSERIGTPAIDVSPSPPIEGEKVYYMGFPRGIGGGTVVPAFTGYFSGTMKKRSSTGKDVTAYSVPVAPGSSGSSILNIFGEIVGVIHSYIPAFDNIALSAPHSKVVEILEESEKQYDLVKDTIEKDF